MRTGELAAAGGLTAKTVRFYEERGLLPAPPRTPGGYRDYPPGMVRRLAFIRDARCAGLTLAEIRSVLALRDTGEPPCAQVTALVERHLDAVEHRLVELTSARDTLRRLARRAAVTQPDTCSGDDICSILTGR